MLGISGGYIYICMYMYRGSSYINWLFIPECRCLLCSLSQPCGCSLVVCEQLFVKPFKKFNNLLEFHELPLSPAPLAGTGLCVLQLSLGGEKGDLAEGTGAVLEGLELVQLAHGVFRCGQCAHHCSCDRTHGFGFFPEFSPHWSPRSGAG